MDPTPEHRARNSAEQHRELERWLTEPRPESLPRALELAIELARVDAVEAVFAVILRNPEVPMPAEWARLLMTLPESVRQESPQACLLRAEAATILRGGEPDLLRMTSYGLRDTTLYARHWLASDDSDGVIWAGIMLMFAQRLIPAAPTERALADSWNTHDRMDATIKRFRASGIVLDPAVLGCFHGLSAALAMARDDLPAAAAEAEFALQLGSGPDVTALAEGIAMTVAVFSGRPTTGACIEPIEPKSGVRPWQQAIFDAGWTWACLGRALAALHSLDRQLFEHWLGRVSLKQAVGAGCWTLHAYLSALAARFWSTDLDASLAELEATITHCSIGSPEAYEPFGRRVLAQGRSLLLSGLGATEAAITALDEIPAHQRNLGASIAALTVGDDLGALHEVEAGLHDPHTVFLDRVALLNIRAAILRRRDGRAEDPVDHGAETAVKMALDGETHLGLALLAGIDPELAADVYTSVEDWGSRLRVGLSANRLAAIVDRRVAGPHPFSLTRREQILLPLLASADSVPEIARQLSVSKNTVRKQVVTLRARFGVGSRSELVRKARELGFLTSGSSGVSRSSTDVTQ